MVTALLLWIYILLRQNLLDRLGYYSFANEWLIKYNFIWQNVEVQDQLKPAFDTAKSVLKKLYHSKQVRKEMGVQLWNN